MFCGLDPETAPLDHALRVYFPKALFDLYDWWALAAAPEGEEA